ncbi:MAG: hypothetical protein ACYS9X_03985 [Planctomycetota bacterium]|jgi:hypothetical protein
MRLKLAVAAFLALGAGGCYVVLAENGPVVGVAVRPIYAPIASTGIRVVTNASGDVFYYGGSYYRWWSGRWWRSPTWRSGWTPIAIVPRVFLSIPRTHPRYHVVRHHPLHPARPTHPTHPVHTVRPARPTHPVVKAKVSNEVREAVKARPHPGRPSTPARPPQPKKEKKEKERGRKK